MRKVLIGLCVVFLSFMSVKADARSNKTYKIKSGEVQYEISGAGQTGTETLSFKDFGAKESRTTEMKVKVFGFTDTTTTMMIRKDGWIYNIDLGEKTGTKFNEKAAQKAMSQQMASLGYSDSMIKEMGGVKKGKEVFLGKNCEIYEFPRMSTKVWLYKGVALKSTTNLVGMEMNYVAVKFMENASISDSVFNVPQGIDIEEESFEGMREMRYDQNSQAQMEEAMKEMEETEEDEDENKKQLKKKAFGLLKSMF